MKVSSLANNLIWEVVALMKKYGYYVNDEKLEEKIKGHLRYKTCKILLDRDGHVCAVCFWNISADGITADITDLIIREDYRKKDLMRNILREGLKIWNVKHLRYVRDYNEDGHDRGPKKVIKVERFLRRKA